ncbi:hypothetical protein NITHO_3050007 [Nitrolancea hollandica Lb]|uniref:Uncharacterized protein n=1 Tax=Nitrolancea hollandica Lb TaxID=1129897 RepID=I4EHA0_9BACT|nr:hypothetical protein NITHO_3050007 [Nitrolancea hollandica Lb]
MRAVVAVLGAEPAFGVDEHVKVDQIATEMPPDLVRRVKEFQNAFVRASENCLAFALGERFTHDGLLRKCLKSLRNRPLIVHRPPLRRVECVE